MGWKNFALFIGLTLSGSVFAADYFRVTAPSCLYARTRASRGGNIYDCIPNNTRVEVLNRSQSGYSTVLVNGRKVYMHSKYLRPASQAAARPPARPTPPIISGGATPEPGSGRPGTATPNVIPNEPAVAAPVRPAVTIPADPDPGAGRLTGGVTSPAGPNAGSGRDLYASALSVMSEKIIPAGRSGNDYNLHAPNWPKLTMNGNKIDVAFGGRNKQCMCTSGTATAVAKHFADLNNSGRLKLEQKHVDILNARTFRYALNGNVYSTGALFKEIGGTTIASQVTGMRNAFAQAKRGDVMVIDRNNRTGHATIFNEVRGGKACYWSCNQGAPSGASERCESISTFKHVGFSRFPTDLAGLPARLEALAADTRLTRRFNNSNGMRHEHVAWDRNLSAPNLRQVAAAPDAAR